MKRSLALLVGGGALFLAACSASTDASSYSERGGDGATSEPSAGMGGGSSGGGGKGAAAPGTPGDGTPGSQPQEGLLTAGVWDDNLNYAFYGKYLATQQSTNGIGMFGLAERDAAHQRAMLPGSAKSKLDVTLVLDTTSSMADELAFLQAEFQGIAESVRAKFPQTEPRFGLVVYRDTSDEYLTRTFDFTTDVPAFRANLAAQSAGGGGDWPEAVPQGLQAGLDLGWSQEPDAAKLIFWVADAPQHRGEDAQVATLVRSAVTKGVKIFPVASSGVAPDAELSMRTAAQITGGRYLFLTDDSGVGNAHAEPHIPCYAVTTLSSAIVRMVESEMHGVRREPAASEIVRTVGNPVDGTCTMGDASTVILY